MSHFSHETERHQQPIRVIHLIKGLGPGGAERLLVNQLLTSHGGIEYVVARLIPGKHHLVTEIEANGASTVVVGGGRFWPFGIRSLLRKTQPDLVHVHSPLIAAVVRTLRASRQISMPIVTTEHNRWPRHHALTRLMNKATARFDTDRIAVSEDVRASMSPALQESTSVIDHGVPVDDIAALNSHRAEMRARVLGDAHLNKRVVGIVANFRPEKGYDTFLEAAKIAIESAPQLRFLVIGQGPGEQPFRDAVSQQRLEQHIDVLGYRDDATTVMTAFDIFTLASRHEGKPVSLMEAFALGLPAVCTRAGGIPEAIEHGVNGLLVDVDDAAALASAWVELATDDELRSEIAQAARASAGRFDASNATRSIEGLYRSLLG